MSEQGIGLLALLSMLGLILIRVPIAISMLVTGMAGNIYILGLNATLVQFQLVSWEVATNFILIALIVGTFFGATLGFIAAQSTGSYLVGFVV